MADSSAAGNRRDGVAWPVQVTAWSLGLAACIVGMLGLVAEWEPGLATAQLFLMVTAPIIVMLPERKRVKTTEALPPRSGLTVDWSLALLCGVVSLAVSAGIGSRIGDLPPAYHDEYSYLFQAKTLLAGRLSFPSAPVRPDLFDQMHVLNEGRMACRFYPGTGLWLAPFVALGHPYWGPWLAGAIATMLIYWTGRELGGRVVGFVASLTMALSPGIGLFGNLLLAHHPTLVGLSAFLLGIIRLRRTRSGWDAGLAGAGLSYAMLCRPMTAAGVGLPFGLDVLWWLIRGGESAPTDRAALSSELPEGRPARRVPVLLGLGLPLVCGWCVMLAYNRDVTGDWLTSPYQLYTEIYTPRHVYGFNNVVRGEQHLGPKVIDHYDRWTENLTPSLAASNAFIRWVASWIWTVDVLPLLLAAVTVVGSAGRLDRRWLLVVAAILSLHAVHVPYWYVGIMGWHYVFESAPLWCLLLAAATRSLFAAWTDTRHSGLKIWWLCLIGLSLAGSYFGLAGLWQPRIERGINTIAHPRRQQAEVRRWIEASVTERPALVLIDQHETEASHLDFITNEPGLASAILLARLRAGVTDLSEIARDFPDRSVYVASPHRKSIRRVRP
ncbi:MAG: glycosyltransferase family 39 protein [Candidatus Saccharimonas sp.]|nr:glycosyltransferase family 39 protein [Planctomycetaceae bacterium]